MNYSTPCVVEVIYQRYLETATLAITSYIIQTYNLGIKYNFRITVYIYG